MPHVASEAVAAQLAAALIAAAPMVAAYVVSFLVVLESWVAHHQLPQFTPMHQIFPGKGITGRKRTSSMSKSGRSAARSRAAAKPCSAVRSLRKSG